MQAVAGDIAEKKALAMVRHVDEIKIVAAKFLCHAIFYRDTAPTAKRGAFGEQQLLHLAGQIEFSSRINTVVSHLPNKGAIYLNGISRQIL